MSKQALLDELVRASRNPAQSSGELARMAEDIADQIGNVHDLVAIAEAERTPLIVQAVGAPISRCGWGSSVLVADVHVVTRYAALALEFPTTQSIGASLGGLLSLTLQHSRYRVSDDEQKVVSELVARALEEWTSELDTYLMNTEALQLLRTLGTRSNLKRLLGGQGFTTVGVQLRARREALVALKFDGVPELLRLWSL